VHYTMHLAGMLARMLSVNIQSLRLIRCIPLISSTLIFAIFYRFHLGMYNDESNSYQNNSDKTGYQKAPIFSYVNY